MKNCVYINNPMPRCFKNNSSSNSNWWTCHIEVCIPRKTFFHSFELANAFNGRIRPFTIFLVYFVAPKFCPWDWVGNVSSCFALLDLRPSFGANWLISLTSRQSRIIWCQILNYVWNGIANVFSPFVFLAGMFSPLCCDFITSQEFFLVDHFISKKSKCQKVISPEIWVKLPEVFSYVSRFFIVCKMQAKNLRSYGENYASNNFNDTTSSSFFPLKPMDPSEQINSIS